MTTQHSFLPQHLGKYLLSLFVITVALATNPAQAASKVEIDAYVSEALKKFYKTSAAGKNLASRAKGMLIFPRVYKAGIGIGGEYGEGALRIGGTNVAYYSTASASIGFQLGAQRKAQLILFMTSDALSTFRNSDGWEAGVDGSVAIATFGAGGDIDTKTAQKPIIGFIISNEGLMYNLSLEGSKITQLQR
ncbi:MAG: YSC84-related protein [Candidatus Reddybacter sp.]